MELDAFVTKTLVQIVKGVSKAQDIINKSKKVGDASIVPVSNDQSDLRSDVKFDVAVTVSGSAGADAKLAVLQIGAGAKGSIENTKVSRITFTVPVVYPAQEEE